MANLPLRRTILYAPCLPFIVLFGNAITEPNQQDLNLLGSTVQSLSKIAERSLAVSRLHEVCDRFYRAASHYLEQLQLQGNDPYFGSSVPVVTGAATVTPSLSYNTGTTNVQDTVMAFQELNSGDMDAILNQWELGYGAEYARELSNFFVNPQVSDPGMDR